MTIHPQTIEVTASAGDALSLLSELHIRHLPVMDNGQLVGILSDRDLRELFGAPEDADTLVDRLETSVAGLMSTDLQCVAPEDEIADVIDLMIEHRLGGVPVVTQDPQSLVGMVSYVDIIRAARDVL